MEGSAFTAEDENERRVGAFQEVVLFGGGVSWCVWGGGGKICGQERTPLVIVNGSLTAQRYIDDILRPTAIPLPQQQPRGVIYWHYNARPHTARMV